MGCTMAWWVSVLYHRLALVIGASGWQLCDQLPIKLRGRAGSRRRRGVVYTAVTYVENGTIGVILSRTWFVMGAMQVGVFYTPRLRRNLRRSHVAILVHGRWSIPIISDWNHTDHFRLSHGSLIVLPLRRREVNNLLVVISRSERLSSVKLLTGDLAYGIRVAG
jgi:hypothetical protein